MTLSAKPFLCSESLAPYHMSGPSGEVLALESWLAEAVLWLDLRLDI